MTNSFIKPENIQGSPEWLENRKKFIGASDAPILMGKSPWRTPYQLWQDKLGLSEPQPGNPAMRRGTEMEPVAREAFEKEFSLEVFPQVVYHKEYKFMMASLDGLTLDGKTAVEIKCPGESTHYLALLGEVPKHYMTQLQHQMACADLDSIWYYSFNGKSGASVHVERDDDYISKMIDQEIIFWECVLESSPPSLTNRDYLCRDSATWAAMSSRIDAIDAQMSSLKNEKEVIRNELIKDADGQSSKGCGLTLTRTFPKGLINYKNIPELDGVDLELYRSPPKERWTLKRGRSSE